MWTSRTVLVLSQKIKKLYFHLNVVSLDICLHVQGSKSSVENGLQCFLLLSIIIFKLGFALSLFRLYWLISFYLFFRGTLFNLLVILISKPQIPKSCPVFDIQLVADSTLVEMSFDAEVRWEFGDRLDIIYRVPGCFSSNVDHNILEYRNIIKSKNKYFVMSFKT